MRVRKATQKDTSFCHLLFIFQGAISAVSGILKQLKRPHKKVAVNPYDISELKTSLQSCENTNCTVIYSLGKWTCIKEYLRFVFYFFM